jgi:metal-responsive CopG/Arc/MetJ family transcriptional regulator
MKETKRIHIELKQEVFDNIEEWNKIHGLNTTAFIRLAIREKLKKENL